VTYNASAIVDRHVESGRADKPAFIAADTTLTYEGLRTQVNRAGGLLKELGVGREHRVLLVLDDTTAFPIMFLGAMRIGADVTADKESEITVTGAGLEISPHLERRIVAHTPRWHRGVSTVPTDSLDARRG